MKWLGDLHQSLNGQARVKTELFQAAEDDWTRVAASQPKPPATPVGCREGPTS
jgi:hypothetical protein